MRVVDKQGSIALPGYTHMQQAMPSSVKLWAGGYANELRDDAAGLRATLRRIDKSPLGSAAGYGAPALKLDREATAKEMGFASVQVPVTSVQLSRGKAESQLLFEIALTMQDLGRAGQRPAAVLYAGVRVREAAGCVHHRLIDHAAEAESGCV